jgi:hypothetical protein
MEGKGEAVGLKAWEPSKFEVQSVGWSGTGPNKDGKFEQAWKNKRVLSHGLVTIGWEIF